MCLESGEPDTENSETGLGRRGTHTTGVRETRVPGFETAPSWATSAEE